MIKINSNITILGAIFGVLGIILLTIFYSATTPTLPLSAVTTAPIQYKATVCVYVNDRLIDCSSNVFTELGQNITRDRLGTTPTDKVVYIGLGNSSAPTKTSTSLDNEYKDCGLARTAGTFKVNETGPGRWSVENTFTSTCNNRVVNTTGLFDHASETNRLFAGNTFTEVTLQANDKITVIWHLEVE